MPLTTPVPLSSPVYDQITAKIRESYPNACICWLEEVHNQQHNDYFEKQKRIIAEKRDGQIPTVLQLFHGTTEPAVNSILADGFDPAYSKVAAYGKGTYFATTAAYSRTYAKPKAARAAMAETQYDEISYMFIADVLVGAITTTLANKETDTSNYDISVNNPKKPSIYSTPYRWGAIPRYVVAFYQATYA